MLLLWPWLETNSDEPAVVGFLSHHGDFGCDLTVIRIYADAEIDADRLGFDRDDPDDDHRSRRISCGGNLDCENVIASEKIDDDHEIAIDAIDDLVGVIVIDGLHLCHRHQADQLPGYVL